MKAKTEAILEEIRRIRDEHAKKFNYDLAAISADDRRFAAELKQNGVKFSRPKRKPMHAEKLAA